MTKQKGCLVAVALIVLVGVLGILSAESDQRREIEAADPGAKTRTEVSPDSVVLNFRTGRATIVATLPDGVFDSTGTAFVWAYYTNPGFNDGSWSSFPVRVRRSPAGGKVRAVVDGYDTWNNANVPDSGFLARVFAGPDSATLAQFSLLRDKDQAKGRPVQHIRR